MTLLRSHIGGVWRDGARVTADINPANPAEVVATVSLCDPALATEALDAASTAFPSWRATAAPARGEILRKAADLLEQRIAMVSRDFTREEGKTLVEATAETKRAVAILRYYAGQTLEPDGETFPSHLGNTFLYSRREPVGVVTAITPWNFPLAIPAWKLAPALAYGNTVVWKPADLVPLTSVHLLQVLIEAGLPPGVLNLVLGKGSEVGDVLVTNAGVTAISFTGSNDVGRAIHLKAAQHNKRVQLEMGGKNPAIVLSDADLDHAAEQVARGAFMSAGQKCSATSRVIVESPVYDEFQERLATLARNWRLGDPLKTDTQVGPLVSEDQLNRVLGYMEVGAADGCRVLVGGGRAESLGDGYYMQPTVLTDVRPDSRVSREEIFGPVACLLAASSYEDAVRLANDTPYGLTASLFTRDLGKALRFASDIRAGVVKINQETAGVEFQVPFGGMKQSSSGSREQGKAAREFFTEWKSVYIDYRTMS